MSGEEARRVTSLLIWSFLGGGVLFCFSFLVFVFGGFKGQVRWPEGPPHLALNLPYLFCCFCCFCLLCFVF